MVAKLWGGTMGTFWVVVVIGAALWLLLKVLGRIMGPAKTEPAAMPNAEPSDVTPVAPVLASRGENDSSTYFDDDGSDEDVKVEHLSYPRPAYFPDLPTKQLRCVGTWAYLTDQERDGLRLRSVVAVPEPDNEYDPNAVAIVRHDGRKVGYLTRAQAAAYVALVGKVGALKVDVATRRGSILLQLPSLPALRKAVQ